MIDWAALWPKLVNVARRRCGPDDAQDAVQEVALRLLTMPNPPEFSTAKDAEAYLAMAVVNKARSFYRSAQKGWPGTAPYLRAARHLPLHVSSVALVKGFEHSFESDTYAGAVWPDYAALVDDRDRLRGLPPGVAKALVEYSERSPMNGAERAIVFRLRRKLRERAGRPRQSNTPGVGLKGAASSL